MANRIEVFDVTVPALTAKTSPATTLLPFNDGEVESIHVVVPDGVSGLAGFFIAYGTQQMVPNTRGAFIVSNDEKIEWDIQNLPVGSQWQFVAYNTDVYPHTFHLRFSVSDFGLAAPSLAIQPAFAIPAVELTAPDVTTTDTTVPADTTLDLDVAS